MHVLKESSLRVHVNERRVTVDSVGVEAELSMNAYLPMHSFDPASPQCGSAIRRTFCGTRKL